MKKIILLVLAIAAGWWFWNQRSKLTENDVRAYYEDMLETDRKLDAEASCARMADEYKMTISSNAPEGASTVSVDKAKSCEASRQAMAMMSQAIANSGGAALDMSYEIRSIAIAPDGKSAAVDLASTTVIANKHVFKSAGTETLVRRNGKILSLGGQMTSDHFVK